jgi:hypothetical protein
MSGLPCLSGHRPEVGKSVGVGGTGFEPLTSSDLPDGQINARICQIKVQPLREKYSVFPKSQISLYPWPSRLIRGAFRDRHGREAGCGGRGGCF